MQRGRGGLREARQAGDEVVVLDPPREPRRLGGGQPEARDQRRGTHHDALSSAMRCKSFPVIGSIAARPRAVHIKWPQLQGRAAEAKDGRSGWLAKSATKETDIFAPFAFGVGGALGDESEDFLTITGILY